MTVSVFSRDILPLLPVTIKEILGSLPVPLQDWVEEVRLTVGSPIYLLSRGKERPAPGAGKRAPYRVSVEDVNRIVQVVSKYSLYAFEEELKNGYITIPGGHRVGLTGRAILEGGRVRRLCSLSSVNIRVARQVLDAARPLLPLLLKTRGKGLCHTLIVSPPGRGKTTLLRDIARMLSCGSPWLAPLRVGIVDERSEICGCYQGVPQLDVGPRTDVLDACPKAEGMMMLIRAMAPRVIVTDEIGREEDVCALRESLNAGVVVVTSAHGSSYDDLRGRPVFRRILEEGFFQRLVILGSRGAAGTLEAVLDGAGRPLNPGGVPSCSFTK